MVYLILGASSFYGKSFIKLLKSRGEKYKISDYRLGSPLTPSADCLVNFASMSSVVESWDDPEDWMETNAVGMTYLARSKVKRFIHVSTPEVYGSTDEWVTERHRLNPTTPYAVSRAAADMLLNAYFKAYGFPVIITRTANIYGVGQQPYRLIPKAFSGDIKIHGDGLSQRSFIHVQDACEALYLLSKEGQLGHTYHISTKRALPILEVVRMVYKLTGRKFNPEFIPERLGKDYAYWLNSDKIRKLGWSDKITLEEGLNEYHNHT